MDVGLFVPVLNTPEIQQQPSEPAAPPAGEVAPAPAPAEEEHSDGQSWWSRLWSTRGHHVDQLEESSPAEESAQAAPIAPRTVTLTEDELNQRVQREAQSLHDRTVARRNREAQEAERRRLRDQDPVTYAAQDRERELTEETRQQQTAQLVTLLGHVGRQHDAVSIDPIVNALPATERQRILSLPQAGEGLPGRKMVVDEALKTLGRLEYERGYRDAQKKLSRDPVFRKSVLSELRGQYQEPELYPGNGSPAEGLDDGNVSTILRRQFFQR